MISDGELTRFDVNHPETNGMIEHFVQPMSGISSRMGRKDVDDFRAQQGMGFRTQPAAVVEGPIGEGELDLPSSWQMVKELTASPLKFTVTAPYMLAKTLLDRHYGDLPSLTMAIAEVLRRQVEAIDAPVLQVDEANLTGNPEDSAWAYEPINHVLDGARGERALHLCFGNYGGQSIQSGFWASLLGFLNNLHVDHLVLEFARRGYDELEVFTDLREGIALGIGVVDIKDNEVESPDVIAARIQHAVDLLGEERVKWVHPDCGFWMLPRSVADRKMETLVAGRDLFLGQTAA